MTFIIAVGQNELLTKSDVGEVSECHVIRITDIENADASYGWYIRKEVTRVEERGSCIAHIFRVPDP